MPAARSTSSAFFELDNTGDGEKDKEDATSGGKVDKKVRVVEEHLATDDDEEEEAAPAKKRR